MASRLEWLGEGMKVLAEDGARSLTIETLTGRLGVTKGSFYHHFKGMAGYRSALLAHFEAEWTTRYIAATGAGTARERLDGLLDLVVTDDRPDPEPAIRAWAQQDPEVHAAQERVDRTRVEYLHGLLREAGDPADADTLAHLLYLLVVGASHVAPPVTGERLREMCTLLMRRLPE